ncbi:TolC family protein [Paraburkholderia sp. 22099]|jgi:outer membrane protein TolC|uniref:Outer membrane protein TolC n=1 Tax=Paraburkholderia terricola TaxID=169427 RepID=A0A1M6KYX7_9BURK|nr:MULTISPECIES: TolC family protein [Paraburkholderia]ORC49046.1 RND transporter [Burkholderia sp. A27]AXE92066.1 RND transporter [Paraburkholderia terricola]MDR6408449.1 outer membrane protein TolC [Paraburkholderia terricola]MDR6447747.1 outer membrane protein TolC [Paraburkholderia terricola]MDR6481629.1 outer membrane protein TolC [Paraburkholderia terricola]
MSSPLFSGGRIAALAVALTLLAGCTTFSKDGGFNTVSTTASERLAKDAVLVKTDEDRDAVAKRTQELLAKPLSMDDAVQIALLNNRGLQASYAELGISEADLVQAGRLPNPGFSFSRTHGGNELSISRTFTLGVLGVLTLPLATKIESRRFEQTKLLAADAMLKVAADARRAYIGAVAAEQAAAYAAQVKDSAEAGAELALRMQQAGNFSRLDYAREQAFYADAVAQLAKTRQQSVSAREKLTRTMGLWGPGTQYALPERLPDLPKARPELNDLESFAMQNRLDIQAAKLQTQSVASSLGLSKATRFINALDVGYQNNFTTSDGREQGYEISVEIPLFDWGSSKVARAEAIYMQSANRVAETAINARSEVRESYSAYVTDYDVAKHYRDEVVPIRKTISDELMLRYNGMLASVFELLADSRDQVGAVNSYIDALKDYWLAETDLQQAVGGRLPPLAVASAQSEQAAPAAPAAQPASSTHSEGK